MADSRDHTRKLIGSALLLLLIVIVILGFVALFGIEAQRPRVDGTMVAAIHNIEDARRLEVIAHIAAEQSKAEAERLSLLLNIIFGPVVALVGSVTGYYFGSKAARRQD